MFVCDLTKSEKIRMKAELSDVISHTADRVMWIDLGPAGTRGADCFEFLGIHEPLPDDGTPTIL